ncbi:exopolysaccharide biosynthesis polyprenyl glycosylphosphotransferase [Urechidicola croceus]|uniref:Undecaprenyl-phosphate glucose phosphotransferase n=1 Tax=Urechidicola croceus TaxID=1850246 RepID=A0A1D8P9C9_9FLAO|nr:exopolysaccharide biosynthesis polyprenyl glycosylphosphotransferase [Urechidicola croceus]AOW21176.1 undecaprenyl-phosphate glucose phosphotransferase [Urechidicola croceus]
MSKRYSIYLTPISIFIDLLIINISIFIIKVSYLTPSFIIYINFGWLIISFYTKFYNVYRYTKQTKIISLLIVQLGIFFLAYFAYFSLFREGVIVNKQSNSLIIIFTLISFFKILFLFALRNYRLGGGNFRDVIILGGREPIESLTNLFNERSNLGYRFKGYFSDINTSREKYLGKIEDSFNYIIENNIDEIYCSISEFSQKQIKKIIEFGNRNNKVVKLIPDSKGVFSKGLELDYYDYIPVLTLKKLPFDNPIIKHSKRLFDIVFSLLIIVFILSWISCILFVLIKLETKGPLIFKQLRDGLNGKQFECYKFRSMGVNKDADKKQATKEDIRITKIGRFIRKTSIDELPQFINVLKGDMSVVGPRPHMTSQSKKFAKIVDKYFIRNLVKPGVTGLAQVRGLRGEIETLADMENRVRLDIFYINNWSFILDIKIIVQTVFNAIKGEEKAY